MENVVTQKSRKTAFFFEKEDGELGYNTDHSKVIPRYTSYLHLDKSFSEIKVALTCS